MTEIPTFPAPPLLLCQRCELALGHWDAQTPRCPRCYRLDAAEAGERP